MYAYLIFCALTPFQDPHGNLYEQLVQLKLILLLA
jgi:hypothetical protein